VSRLRSARIWYALSLFVALAVAAVLGGLVAYHIAATLIALAGGAALLAQCGKRQLVTRHALDCDICIRGGAARYALQLRNKGLLPLTWAEVKVSSTRGVTGREEPFEAALMPFGVMNHVAEFNPPHRGLYCLMVESIFVSDPFGLTKLNAGRPYPLTLTVMPRLIPISEAWKKRLNPQGQGGIFSQSSDEPAVDSRIYRYGDSQRRIHWNLTARTRELMVRQYESVENRRLLAVLDLSPFDAEEPEACEDALIESCLSVVRYALERQIETTLVYAEGENIRRFTGRDSRIFEKIHHAMCTVPFSAGIPLPQLLQGAERAQMIYLFCAHAPGGELLSSLPPGKPVELAVVRTHKDGAPPPDSMTTLHVTELLPCQAPEVQMNCVSQAPFGDLP
jgi:uncharacterized protein (DUF58 family)